MIPDVPVRPRMGPLDRGDGVQMEKISLVGQNLTLAGYRGPYFLLAGQIYLFTINSKSLAGHFYAREPFMARGPLIVKRSFIALCCCFHCLSMAYM